MMTIDEQVFRTNLIECVDANIIDRATANEMLGHFNLDFLTARFDFIIWINSERLCEGTVESTDAEGAKKLISEWFFDNVRTTVRFSVTNSFTDTDITWSDDVTLDLDFLDERLFDLEIHVEEV